MKLTIETMWKVEFPDKFVTVRGGTEEDAVEATIKLVEEHIRKNIHIVSIEGYREDA